MNDPQRNWIKKVLLHKTSIHIEKTIYRIAEEVNIMVETWRVSHLYLLICICIKFMFKIFIFSEQYSWLMCCSGDVTAGDDTGMQWPSLCSGPACILLISTAVDAAASRHHSPGRSISRRPRKYFSARKIFEHKLLIITPTENKMVK